MLNTEIFKAIYGTFDIEMRPIQVDDVTDNLRRYMKNGIISIPKDESFLKLRRKFNTRKKKFLKITWKGVERFILQDEYTDDVLIDFNSTDPKIVIVYFFYVSNSSNWRAILSGQLLQLKGTGLLPEADLHIHITDTLGYFDEIRTIINRITPDANINRSATNEFEYPAMKLIYDLAHENDDRTFLYFHSKGMTHNLHSRSLEEITIFTETFENWRRNLQLMNKKNADKMGLFTGEAGWIWYNFWFAKGSHISSLPMPQQSPNRYIYEEWVGGKELNSMGWKNSLSLYTIPLSKKKYYTPKEADYHKAGLMYKIFATYESKRIRLFLRSPLLINLYVRLRFLFTREI
jgi:hypothetical protein